MAGRYALASETVGEIMRDLPLWNFSWELRVFPVDYALAKLLDTYLSDRRSLLALYERADKLAPTSSNGDQAAA